MEILKNRGLEIVFNGNTPQLKGDKNEVTDALLTQLKELREEVIERVKPKPRGRILDKDGNVIVEMDHAPTPEEVYEHSGFAAEHYHNGIWKRYLERS